MILMTEKERLGRDLADELTYQDDTDVTVEQVKSWHEWDVYEWLECWDYDWDGERWVNVEMAGQE